MNLLLVTSNGTGMGHLTRQVAVARAADHAWLFSLSLGLPLATSLGLRGEYCPSYDVPHIASRQWHAYLRDRLIALAEEVAADAVVFDGVAPYPGLALAAADLNEVAFIWLRRGMWKPGAGRQHLDKGQFFDLILEPGDLGSSHDAGITAHMPDVTRIGPISILESEPMLDRSQARLALGLPEDKPIALVTLGSGLLGDVAGPGKVAVETILDRFDGWHVAVTKSPVAENEVPVSAAGRISKITGVYPLARYLGAFDMAVSSAGYNAAHELIPAGVPTVFVANTSTRTDDQVARARGVAESGLGLGTTDANPEELTARLMALRDEAFRVEVADRTQATMERMTGAADTVKEASQYLGAFAGRPKSAGPQYGPWRNAKELAKKALGESGTNAVKRMLGRDPGPSHQRTRVVIADDGPEPGGDVAVLRVLKDLKPEDLRQSGPVEHVLAGSSEGYEERRRALIDIYYDVVS